MATSIHTFAGNVGIGTNDPKAYALNVADGGITRITSLSATNIQVGSVTNSFIPAGTIAMWGNDPVPTGWVICNGANGTPNLNGKFIIGAGNSYAVNATGGTNSTITLSNSNMPQHNHTATTGNQSANHGHPITDPGHLHSQKATDDSGIYEGTSAQSANYYGQIGFNTASANMGTSLGQNNANHNHQIISTNGVGSNTPTAVSVWPINKGVIFIMKT